METVTETMSISLRESLKQYVEARVAAGGYGTPSEYIEELVRRDREVRRREAQEKLEGLLLEGLESGPAEVIGAEEWEAIRREGVERLVHLQEERPMVKCCAWSAGTRKRTKTSWLTSSPSDRTTPLLRAGFWMPWRRRTRACWISRAWARPNSVSLSFPGGRSQVGRTRLPQLPYLLPGARRRDPSAPGSARSPGH